MKYLVIIALLIPTTSVAFTRKERVCLYNATFHEASIDGRAGKRAVMDVVINRAKQQKKSVCQVIAQKAQFSWYKKKPLKQLDTKFLSVIMNTPRQLDSRYTFFYLTKMKKRPKWSNKMSCKAIGLHQFCKEKVK